jgi:DNA-binding transcriptional ArsR family regulator
MNGYKHIAHILKALAHPARLRILETLLDEEEACVCHLEQRLGLRQAYLSQQLAKLREVGLVNDRRDGLNIYYAIAIDGLDDLLVDIRQLALDTAGMGLTFPALKVHGEDPCGCPRCAVPVSQDSA